MKRLSAYLMLAPAMAFFLLSFIAPLAFVGRLSLFNSDFVTWKYVGLDNYVKAIGESMFLRSFANTGFYILAIAGGVTTLSYMVASVIYDMKKRVQGAMIFIFFAPTLTSGIIMSMMWKWLFLREGLVNWLLGLIGIGAVGWFSTGLAAKTVISITMIAGTLGSYVLIFFANMLAVSTELFDQASIDGASKRQKKRYIMLPLMVPTIVLISLLTMLGATQMMETLMWMTGGGPAGRTATPTFDVYRTGFLYGEYGLAAAKSIIVIAIVSALTFIKRRVERW